jgi:MFS family permease
MRMLAGFCVAGTYTIIESWLQAKATNETRGRTMGVYRVVDVTGSLGAQLLIGVLEPAAYVSYNLLALLCCAALLPLTLTRVEQPETPPAPRLRPRLAWDRSPLAAAGVVVSGLTASAFRMVGPVYGVEVGLTTDQIAIFLAAFVLGGALSQYPAGWLADKFDRRWVLIWLSAAGIATSAVTIALSTGGRAWCSSPRRSSASRPSRSTRSRPPTPTTSRKATNGSSSPPRSCSSTPSAPSPRPTSPRS